MPYAVGAVMVQSTRKSGELLLILSVEVLLAIYFLYVFFLCSRYSELYCCHAVIACGKWWMKFQKGIGFVKNASLMKNVAITVT